MREETAISTPNFYNFLVYAKQTRERGGPSGGITCLNKPHLAHFEVLLREEDPITAQTRICAIIAAYFNPDRYAVDVVDRLSRAINALQRKEGIILAGDFNCTMALTEFLNSTTLEIFNRGSEPTFCASVRRE